MTIVKRLLENTLAGSKSFWLAVDCLILPIIIFLLLYEPNYADGILLHLEAGQHLGAINEILNGKIPYRDFFSLYGPLNDVIPACVMKLSSITVQTLRAYFHFTTIIGIIIGYFLAINLFKTRFFGYTAVFLFIIETFHPFWSSRWGGFRSGLGLLVLLALVLSMNSRNKKKWLIGAGISHGIALLNSTEIGVFVSFGVLAYYLAETKIYDLKTRKLRSIVYPYAIGFGLIIVPFLVYYTVEMALDDYLFVAFIEIPLNHVSKFGQGGATSIWPDGFSLACIMSWLTSYRLKIYLPALILAAVPISLAMSSGRKQKLCKADGVLLMLFAYGAPLYFSSFRAIKGPQFNVSITPAIFIGCIFLERAFQQIKFVMSGKKWKEALTQYYKKILAPSFGLLLAFSYILSSDNKVFGSTLGWISYEINKVYNYSNKGAGRVPLEIERAGGIYLPIQQAKEIAFVYNYIQSHVLPGEPVFVFPDMGLYYFLTDKPNLTRYPTAVTAAMSDLFRKELTNEVVRHRPRYIVYDTRNSHLAMSIRAKDRELLPELFDFIWKNYHIEVKYESLLVLRRNQRKGIL